MTISDHVLSELFRSGVASSANATTTAAMRGGGAGGASPLGRPLSIIRLPQQRTGDKYTRHHQMGSGSAGRSTTSVNTPRNGTHAHWTSDEHERFLGGMQKFPTGPWKAVAEFVGTKTPRQVMSHAQKYRQRIRRHERGLRYGRRRHQKSDDLKQVARSDETMTEVDNWAPDGIELLEATTKPSSVSSPHGVSDLGIQFPEYDQLMQCFAMEHVDSKWIAEQCLLPTEMDVAFTETAAVALDATLVDLENELELNQLLETVVGANLAAWVQ